MDSCPNGIGEIFSPISTDVHRDRNRVDSSSEDALDFSGFVAALDANLNVCNSKGLEKSAVVSDTVPEISPDASFEFEGFSECEDQPLVDCPVESSSEVDRQNALSSNALEVTPVTDSGSMFRFGVCGEISPSQVGSMDPLALGKSTASLRSVSERTPVISEEVLSRMQTRSLGLVQNLPHVLDRPIERQTRNKRRLSKFLE